MKIGLYGVSRAGKDYLLTRAAGKIAQLRHVRGSDTLERLAAERAGRPFSEITEDEKVQLRIAVTEEVKKAEHETGIVCVDGHYAFPDNDNEFRVVFTEADKNLYDVFIYLNTAPEQVVRNQKQPEHGRKVIRYTAEEIKRWQDFEIAEMELICAEQGKELFVIDGDIPCCVEFLSKLIAEPQTVEPRLIARQVITDNLRLLNSVDTVILLDCDRTLTKKDTTPAFCKAAGIPIQKLGEVYRGDYYSIYQFYKANKIYDEVRSEAGYSEACNIAADAAIVNNNLIDDIRSGEQNYTTIGITSGITDIWEKIRNKSQIPQVMVGKGRDSGVYVSIAVKQIIAEELRALGKRVIAAGDSKLDIKMLETADSGYIIADDKLNTWVTDYFKSNNGTNIRQLTYSALKYDRIEEANSIWA